MLRTYQWIPSNGTDKKVETVLVEFTC